MNTLARSCRKRAPKCPLALPNDLLALVFDVLWRTRGEPQSAAEILDLVLARGVTVTAHEIDSTLSEGGARGLYTVICGPEFKSYTYNQSALQVNYANRTYAGIGVQNTVADRGDMYRKPACVKGDYTTCNMCVFTPTTRCQQKQKCKKYTTATQ